MQDYYEILQVHPKADTETIRAAYARLCERYDPQQLEGAADELVALAQQKREEIDRAYAVLSDAQRRTDYDQQLIVPAASSPDTSHPPSTHRLSEGDTPHEDDLIDYRPLPPARKQERPRDFNPQPYLTPTEIQHQRGRQGKQRIPFWGGPAMVAAILTFIVGLTSLIITNGGGPRPAPIDASQPGDTVQQGQQQQMSQADIAHQFEDQIVQARQVAEQVPDNPNAWINLGNTLYDSVEIVREHLPDSETYEAMLPRWLEATEAYEKALELDPSNATVRSDLAVSLCHYGTGTDDQTYVEQGLQEAQQAASDDPEDPRVLLNLGTCLVSTKPPHTEEALKQWRRILVMPEAAEGVVMQAQRLIAQHS